LSGISKKLLDGESVMEPHLVKEDLESPENGNTSLMMDPSKLKKPSQADNS